MKKTILIILNMILFVNMVSAEVIFSDDFDHPPTTDFSYPFNLVPGWYGYGWYINHFGNAEHNTEVISSIGYMCKPINTSDYENLRIKYDRKIFQENGIYYTMIILFLKDGRSGHYYIEYDGGEIKDNSFITIIDDTLERWGSIDYFSICFYLLNPSPGYGFLNGSMQVDNVFITGDPIITDEDNDGIPDSEDKCLGTTGEQIVYGCSCGQILELKPGKDESRECSEGIIEVFTKKMGWAKDLFG